MMSIATDARFVVVLAFIAFVSSTSDAIAIARDVHPVTTGVPVGCGAED
jgi:hypothetical protein